MKLGIYTPFLHQQQAYQQALLEFLDTSCLQIDFHFFSTHRALLAELTHTPMDLLFYDLSQAQQGEQDLGEVRFVLPYSSLILMGDPTTCGLLGYGVGALDFMPAPVPAEELVDTLIEWIRRQVEVKRHYLPIKINGVWSRLNMEHLVYVESAGHTLIFHMDDQREFRMTAAFRDYWNYLTMNRHFCCCHKSYVVNLSHVAGLEQNAFRLRDGNTINISRPYRQQVRTYYACYVTQSYDKDTLLQLTQQPNQQNDS